MKWSPQQDAALIAVKKWLDDKKSPQIFRLFGFAGTGKTTVAKEIADLVNGSVLFACFTGKAALVLRKKGCGQATTIHSLIYKAVENPITGVINFELNSDSILRFADLIIIDEVSMVNEELGQDLLSFGVKVLVLGDPAQLPPVKGEGFFISAMPDVMLTEVHRQAADNPIIRLSMHVRLGQKLTPGDYGLARIINKAEIDKEELRDIVISADQLLCGTNKTRMTFNSRIRQIKGLYGIANDWQPVAGDRLVCLKNNREKGLLNGGLWDVTSSQSIRNNMKVLIDSLDDDQKNVEISVPNQFFNGTEKEMDWRDRKRADEFTYGWALTVHKSQGSQWNNVVLFDESQVFREDAAKHLYTGITRAAEKLTVLI